MSAIEYLTEEAITPLGAVLLDLDWLEEDRVFEKALHEWIANASEEALRELVSLARTLGKPLDEVPTWRLIGAAEQRGVPSLDEIGALADELDNDDLRKYVAEKRVEGPPSG